MSRAELRRADLVEVKSPSEILATLDERGALAGLPFMPEMARYCGRRFSVDRRADRICDTIHYTGSRRLHGAVLLEDLRCDGSGHDGCQAECRFFWKEAVAAPRDAGDACLRAAAGTCGGCAGEARRREHAHAGAGRRGARSRVIAARPPSYTAAPSTSSSGTRPPTCASTPRAV